MTTGQATPRSTLQRPKTCALGGPSRGLRQVREVTRAPDAFVVETAPQNLSEGFLECQYHPDHAPLLGRAGWENFRTRYTSERIAALTEEVYRQVPWRAYERNLDVEADPSPGPAR